LKSYHNPLHTSLDETATQLLNSKKKNQKMATMAGYGPPQGLGLSGAGLAAPTTDTFSDNRVELKFTISNVGSEVFCIRFSPDGKFLAAGCGDGSIRVFQAQNGTMAFNLRANGNSNDQNAITALKFRPVTASARTKNIFIAANSSGSCQQWHMTSAKLLHSYVEDGNIAYTLDYNEEGNKFITAGKDSVVRVYDEASRSLLTTMSQGDTANNSDATGHTNKIFSCKAVPGDENVFLTGGWDDTVQIWDIRVGAAVRQLRGPHICGDSLDIFDNDILTGSWRPDKQLEIWDYRTGTMVTDIPWGPSQPPAPYNFKPGGITPSPPVCMVYAAQFSKEGTGRYIAAGGSNLNEALIFDHLNNNEIIGSISNQSHGIFTLDFSPDNKKFAIATADGTIKIYEILE
jgi:COMPASS component SWD3